jgi:hypothetical protein
MGESWGCRYPRPRASLPIKECLPSRPGPPLQPQGFRDQKTPTSKKKKKHRTFLPYPAHPSHIMAADASSRGVQAWLDRVSSGNKNFCLQVGCQDRPRDGRDYCTRRSVSPTLSPELSLFFSILLMILLRFVSPLPQGTIGGPVPERAGLLRPM